MTFGLDGKLVYASSGDIIDAKTRKIVGSTKSEFGTRMFSEKELDMEFKDGHLQRVSNQFGNEFGDFAVPYDLDVRIGEEPVLQDLLGTEAVAPMARATRFGVHLVRQDAREVGTGTPASSTRRRFAG